MSVAPFDSDAGGDLVEAACEDQRLPDGPLQVIDGLGSVGLHLDTQRRDPCSTNQVIDGESIKTSRSTITGTLSASAAAWLPSFSMITAKGCASPEVLCRSK